MGMCLVVLQCARAFENKIAEIARASKNERPGEALLAFFEGGANITGRPARNAASRVRGDASNTSDPQRSRTPGSMTRCVTAAHSHWVKIPKILPVKSSVSRIEPHRLA